MRSLRPRLLSSLDPSPALSLALALTAAATGCGLPDGNDGARVAAAHLTEAPAAPEPLYSRCSTAAVNTADALVAAEGTVAIGADDGAGSGMVARAYRGRGCELVPDGRGPMAVHALVDADDRGSLYAFPRASTEPGVLSTAQPDSFSRNGQVVRIDPQGQITTVVEAGRGIWGFGTSPQGATFWSEACGPTGIFATGSQPLRSVLDPADISWRSNGAVLTGDATMWFLGNPPCQLSGSASQDCRHPLIRSTPAPSGDVPVAALELGGRTGLSGVKLVRCGERPCAVIADTIYVWGDDGSVVSKVRAADLDLGPTHRIEKIAGNRTGVYALLLTGEERRLVFIPLRP